MMEQNKRDIALGRFLSLVLRHRPEAAYLTVDSHGWANVEALLSGCRRAGKPLDRADLERIVRENNKQRYSFNENHTKIRANQGHSIPVDLELEASVPPPVLYHGTATRFLDAIRQKGLLPGSRQYVHLSTDVDTAWKVGGRHGKPVVLALDTQAMVQDNLCFYRSENQVWLCKAVPWQYIRSQIYNQTDYSQN